MLDRRRSHRLNLALPASFEMPGSDEPATGTTINLNTTGLCLSCTQKLAVDTQLPITITLPTKEKIVINGRVIWVKKAS